MNALRWHVARGLLRKRGTVAPWRDRVVEVMLLEGESPASRLQSARRICTQMGLEARGALEVRLREEVDLSAAPIPVRAWQVRSEAGDVLGVVLAESQQRATPHAAWGKGPVALEEIVVELETPEAHDPPQASVRVSVRLGGQIACKAISLQRLANGRLESGQYLACAAWEGLDVDVGFQRAVEVLVEQADSARCGSARLDAPCTASRSRPGRPCERALVVSDPDKEPAHGTP